jgi:hypothetical protein
LLVLVFLYGCSRAPLNGTQAADRQQEAEQFIGSSLPEDAKNIHVFSETGGGSNMSGSGKAYEIMVDKSDVTAYRVYLRVDSI